MNRWELRLSGALPGVTHFLRGRQDLNLQLCCLLDAGPSCLLTAEESVLPGTWLLSTGRATKPGSWLSSCHPGVASRLAPRPRASLSPFLGLCFPACEMGLRAGREAAPRCRDPLPDKRIRTASERNERALQSRPRPPVAVKGPGSPAAPPRARGRRAPPAFRRGCGSRKRRALRSALRGPEAPRPADPAVSARPAGGRPAAARVRAPDPSAPTGRAAREEPGSHGDLGGASGRGPAGARALSSGAAGP